jgi:hypothetical protein
MVGARTVEPRVTAICGRFSVIHAQRSLRSDAQKRCTRAQVNAGYREVASQHLRMDGASMAALVHPLADAG